jgi:membrane protease YdiL (CAAX protease family)
VAERPGRGRSFYLAAEALALFVILPGAVALKLVSVHIILLLLVFTVLCLIVLLRDRSFNRRQLWNLGEIQRHWRTMLGVFALGVVVISLGVWLFKPNLLFNFIERAPRIWALVMILYPLFSVYPQELVYRAFFFHRYQGIFPSRRIMIVANAAAFGFMHIVFQNWIAVVMTFLGGLLFARTYEKTRSLAVVSVEHALYGCYIFTIGLGIYFYHGAVH